ncbi:MAG: uracil-DNA glycosylase [Thermoanaerobaculia bacterium]
MQNWLEYFKILGFEEIYLKKTPKKDQRIEKLKQLEKTVKNCTKCPLYKKRKQAVFADGNPYSPLMFIGEAPGEEEDKQGLPFVGRAGQLLTKLIKKMGLEREDVYITNIVKCRPENNRDPLPEEIEKCVPYLLEQIELIKPKVIVTLGRFSGGYLTKMVVGIKQYRGKWFEFNGIPVMPTFHPSYLLRNPQERWHVWDDMKEVLKKLNLKIPE